MNEIRAKHTRCGAPSADSPRVLHRKTGRTGNVVPAQGRDDGVRVLFDGDCFSKPCDPRAVQYLADPAGRHGGGRR